MRALVAAAAVLVISGGLSAQDKKFESRAGKYAVAFPGEPKVESKKAGEVTMNTAAIDAKGVAYMVIYSDLPADAIKTTKADEILESGEKGLVASFKARGVKSQATTFGKDKHPARTVTAEVLVDTTTLQLRVTLVLVEGRLYQVVAIGPKDGVTGQPGDKFFDSFEIKK